MKTRGKKRKRPPKGKARAQFHHAKRRLAERFDLHLSYDQLQAIVLLIRSGQTRLVERQSHRVAIHAVQVEGRTLHVVYDRARKQIVTALYPNGLPDAPTDVRL
jgi:hypothetical protein